MRVLFEYTPRSVFQLTLEFLIPLALCALLLAFLWKVAYPKWTKNKKNTTLSIFLSIWLIIFFPIRSSLTILNLIEIKNAMSEGRIEKYNGQISSVKYMSGKLYLVEINNKKFKMRNSDVCFNFGKASDITGEIYMEYLVIGELSCAVKVLN